MKTFLNIMIALFVIWFLLISETQDVSLIAKSMVFFAITLVARLNYKMIIEFFHEKDPL